MAWVEKDHNDHPVPTPCYVQSHQPPDQAAQSHNFSCQTSVPCHHMPIQADEAQELSHRFCIPGATFSFCSLYGLPCICILTSPIQKCSISNTSSCFMLWLLDKSTYAENGLTNLLMSTAVSLEAARVQLSHFLLCKAQGLICSISLPLSPYVLFILSFFLFFYPCPRFCASTPRTQDQ